MGLRSKIHHQARHRLILLNCSNTMNCRACGCPSPVQRQVFRRQAGLCILPDRLGQVEDCPLDYWRSPRVWDRRCSAPFSEPAVGD